MAEDIKDTGLEAPNKSPKDKPVWDMEERVNLRLEDYSAKEIAFAMKNAEPGETPTEVFKKDFVQAGIEGLRQKVKAEGGIPEPTSRSIKVDKKTFAEMTPEERKKNFKTHHAKFFANASQQKVT
jgi:hypothetical protein